ncbi:MAG: hypothetical protein AB1633_02030 [Elusimicrobiota bacterium]
MGKINLKKLRRVSINKRRSNVCVEDFVDLGLTGHGGILSNIPDILAGKNFKNLVNLTNKARAEHKQIILMFGAHIIKCGLSPIIIDLMRRGFITAIATNGASMIHDFEIAFCGRTSEEVAEGIKNGNFGITQETAVFINNVAKLAAQRGKGLGEMLGQEIEKKNFKFGNLSIFAASYKFNIPATVHVGIGTDVIYQHKECDGASWGKASYTDFLKFCAKVAELEGGVALNFGSAVILPEVFLKAVNLARNLGYKLKNFTAANFDMIHQYRPVSNIVKRPVGAVGTGYNFVGHHEFMLPLLYNGLISCKIK